MDIDPELRKFCNTDRQREVFDLMCEHGNGLKVANILGMHRSAPDKVMKRLRDKAARLGYAPGHFENGVASGFRMGKVTVQRGPNGVERVWERQHPDSDRLQAALEEVGERLGEMGSLGPVEPPRMAANDLMTLYPLGDPHFGLLTWEREVGVNFDLEIAEDITFKAVDRLVGLAPLSGTGVLLNLGDFFHADNSRNETPLSGNKLDVDGRFEKIAETGIMAMIRCVMRMLEKHKHVIVRCMKGNHDPHQASMLAIALMAWFRNEPRVTVDTSPSQFWYYPFGKVLIGSTHGDGPKLQELPGIMACDKPQEWGDSMFRVWHTGHVHHNSALDYPGCQVETHRTLAAQDAWHKWKGYRSVRDLKAITYHSEFGEQSRLRCGINMLNLPPEIARE